MGKDAVVTYETLFEILRRERNREEIQKIEDSFVAEVLDYLMQKQNAPLNQEQNIFSISEKEKSDRQISNAKRILRELYDRREKKIINMALNKAKTNTALINTANLLSHEKDMFKQIIDTLHTYRNSILAKLIHGKEIIISGKETHLSQTDPLSQTNSLSQIDSFSQTDPFSSDIKKDQNEQLSPDTDTFNRGDFSEESGSPTAEDKHSFESEGEEYEEDNRENRKQDKAKEPKVLKGDGFDSNIYEDPHLEKSKDNESDAKNDKKRVRFLESVPKFIGPNLEMYGPYSESDEAELPSEIAAILINKKRAQNANGS